MKKLSFIISLVLALAAVAGPNTNIKDLPQTNSIGDDVFFLVEKTNAPAQTYLVKKKNVTGLAGGNQMLLDMPLTASLGKTVADYGRYGFSPVLSGYQTFTNDGAAGTVLQSFYGIGGSVTGLVVSPYTGNAGPLNGLSNFTALLWFKWTTTSFGANVPYPLLGFTSGAGEVRNGEWWLGVWGQTTYWQAVYDIFDGTGTEHGLNPTVGSDTNWHCLVMTVRQTNGPNVELCGYLDNVKLSQGGNYTGPRKTATELVIAGTAGAGGYNFPGMVSGVKIFDHALNVAELTAEYNRTAPGYLKPLIAKSVEIDGSLLLGQSYIKMYAAGSQIYAPSGVHITYYDGAAVTDSLNCNGALVQMQHLGGAGAAPTIATNQPGAGAGSTVALARHSDVAGRIQYTAQGSPFNDAPILTVTFAKPYSTVPNVTLTPCNNWAASLGTGYYVAAYVDKFELYVRGGITITPGNAHYWYYHVIQ